jgi:hypothetical protein
MKCRKLRIAWSVACGVLCLLLIVLWVRSYWWNDRVYCPLNSTPRMLIGASLWGRITVGAVVLPKDDLSPRGWARTSEYVGHVVSYEEEQDPFFEYLKRKFFEYLNDKFEYQMSEKNGGYIRFPHWLPLLALATLSVPAALPWLRWRFSLRALLIGMTVVAAILGVAIWAAK